jgi:hypothetical protein
MKNVWNKENCHEVALKYETRTEFKVGHSGVYEIARNNNWLDDICSHISSTRCWTKEKCQEDALKCTTKLEFKKNYLGAYNKANKCKWLNELCSHMIDNHWTKEKCQTEAIKYEIRIDFIKNSRAAYSAAYRHDWLNEICSHMKKMGNKLFRCIYVYEFPDNSAYIGLTYNLNKRNTARKLQKNDAVTKYIKKTNLKPNLKQLSEYVHVDVAVLLENDCIEFYKNNGWNVLNKANGGAIGSPERKWTKEQCRVEALKYNNRTDFYNNSNKIHAAACRYGWLNDICSHMIVKNKHWTIDECKEIALKYEIKSEFVKANKAVYAWASRHNILNEICSHMISTLGTNQYKQK